jgi:4-carboxymuconolactone decarboxylase
VTSPRLPPAGSFDEAQHAALAKSPRRPDGRPLNLFATLVRRPALMTRVNALGGYFTTRALLGDRARELVILRVAGTLRCEYEARHHRPAGERAGLSEAELDAAQDPSRDHDWSAEDRALLDAVDELVEHRALSDERWAALSAVLDDDRCLEVLVLTGFYAMVAGTINGAGIEPDPAV